MEWDALKWAQEFKIANPDKKKELLIDVWKNTVKIVQAGRYYSDGEVIIDNSKVCQNSLFFDLNDFFKGDYNSAIQDLLSYNKNFNTEISVIESDCLEQSRLLENPLVLNMASYKNPGGGVIRGSAAQEENIFRRSNLFESLYQYIYYCDQYGIIKKTEQYPLPFYGGIYSKDVTVFRGSENNGYYLLGTPFQTNIISVSAIKRPELKNGEMNSSDILKMKNKIRTIFQVAFSHSHENLVLSAFGCGSYGNPPEQIAKIFKDVIDNDFNGCFKKIVFSIFDDHNTYKEHNPDGNLKPFKKIFEK